jgi:acetyltransferase-like isoleucine patch superfamily enzyme
MEVGDGCVLGHLSVFCAHMVADIEGKPSLMVRKIRIGERCYIGADSQIGPGVTIAPKTRLPVKTRLYWRGEWK